MPPPDDREPDDDRLVGAAQAGDVRAFEALLLRHEAKVLRVLRFLGVPSEDREDVAQEVFIRVFKHLGGVDRSRPFAAWIYRVTVNAAHDHRARAARREGGESPWSDEADRAAAPGENPEESAREKGLRDRLEAALTLLSERERVVFILKELEGLDTRSIAGALGVTQITVRRHLGLARGHLKTLLGKKDPGR